MRGMPASFSDQRRSLRARRLRQAQCVFNNGTSSLDVTLRDVSASGARVVGDGLAFLPTTFELRTRESDGASSVRRARLVWTDGRTAGLEFIA
jgi:hypothetical protein